VVLKKVRDVRVYSGNTVPEDFSRILPSRTLDGWVR